MWFWRPALPLETGLSLIPWWFWRLIKWQVKLFVELGSTVIPRESLQQECSLHFLCKFFKIILYIWCAAPTSCYNCDVFKKNPPQIFISTSIDPGRPSRFFLSLRVPCNLKSINIIYLKLNIVGKVWMKFGNFGLCWPFLDKFVSCLVHVHIWCSLIHELFNRDFWLVDFI